MKILLMLREAFYTANPQLIEELMKIGEVRVLYTDNGIGKEKLMREMKDVDILLVAVVKIDKEVIDAAPNLKYIIKYGAGYDNIDVSYANQKGIRVSNAPGANAQSVADLAFGLMLSAARNIPHKDQEVKVGQWELSMGYEIHNKTLGIIGFGAIGQALAKRAVGFDMKTLVYGNYQDSEAAKKLHARFVSRDELFEQADYVVIATSLTKANRRFINKEVLKLMKSSAFLINVSRGALINETDLIDALKKGRIRGAALDVFETEPSENELSRLSNVIATPHIGGATYEAITRIGDISVSNIYKWMDGEELAHEVLKIERGTSE